MHGSGGLVAAQVQVWWSADKFGGIGHSTDKIGGHSVVCVQVWWSFSPATDTRTTPRSASGGHVMQVWWSFGSAEVRCHGWVV